MGLGLLQESLKRVKADKRLTFIQGGKKIMSLYRPFIGTINFPKIILIIRNLTTTNKMEIVLNLTIIII